MSLGLALGPGLAARALTNQPPKMSARPAPAMTHAHQRMPLTHALMLMLQSLAQTLTDVSLLAAVLGAGQD